MKYAILSVRIAVGLMFLVLGIDHFAHFLSMPTPELTPAAGGFFGAIGPTGYLAFVKVLEIAGGILLLTGFFVPLGLVVLTPVIVNIALFDVLLMQKPGLGLVLLPLAVFLIWAYRPYFAPVFTFQARPPVTGS